jgi:hypothetical protein
MSKEESNYVKTAWTILAVMAVTLAAHVTVPKPAAESPTIAHPKREAAVTQAQPARVEWQRTGGLASAVAQR